MKMEFNFHIEALGKYSDVYSLFKHLNQDLELNQSYFLESVQEESKELLFSFICLEPDYILEIKNNKYKFKNILTEKGEKIISILESREEMDSDKADENFTDKVIYNVKALDILETLSPLSEQSFHEIFPRNIFYGGYLGYIGYDIVSDWVGYTRKTDFPDVLVGMHTKVLIYNHRTKGLYFIENTLKNGYKPPKSLIHSLKKFHPFKQIQYPYPKAKLTDSTNFISNVKEVEYFKMIDKVKDYIYSGDIIQGVISRKLIVKSEVHDLDIYGALRQLNPSPYMYYLNFGKVRIIGSSPEALLTIDNDKISTVPIAGTRKRGQTPEEDITLEKELLDDIKENAEHVMLVDLARNDLAKISKPGTIKPIDFMRIKKFQNVMHIITILNSLKRDKISSFEVLKSMFPAGTVSGAPKLRAMKIINKLEKDPRGPYAGVVGYCSLNGDCDWAITIRTLFLNKNEITAQAGGGIVKHSQPVNEWFETENKLKSILQAVEMAEDVKLE
ncbi:MAG: anthranilate synthase component I family protein [Candidatus Helarchaeota archaeon]